MKFPPVFRKSLAVAGSLAALLLLVAPDAGAQDPVGDAARQLLEKHKMALVVVTVDGKLVAITDGDPLPERTQQRRTLGVTIRSDNGLIVISNAAVDPAIGLEGQKARVEDKVVTIQSAKTEFGKVEISYGDSKVIPGKVIKQDATADVAFVLPDAGTAKAFQKETFDAIDLNTSVSSQAADEVIGLSRSSAAYGYMPTVILGRVTGVFSGTKSNPRTYFVTTAGTAQGIPVFSLDGKTVGITLERIIEDKRTGILGTLAAESINVQAQLALDQYEKGGAAQPVAAPPSGGADN